MILQFKKITLHNFGSYAETEIALCDRGFCLVSGENHYAKDNALSNGAGKSFIWSGICYALTGETISGLTTNLKNINAESSDNCYVSLDLLVDKDAYTITRFHKPKSDLKIIKNNVDISGKGIRESEKVLTENLPDLTKDLIASTIIIGQGMPNKFSSFSPSGRKELLEKLTKSDFMIEDIKTRLTGRQLEVNQVIKNYSDSLLVNNTNLNNTKQVLQQHETALANIDGQDFETLIEQAKTQISDLTEKITAANTDLAKAEQVVEEINAELLQQTSDKNAELTDLLNTYNAAIFDAKNNKYKIDLEISTLKAEIKQLKSIKDTCPTCGQKLPNVLKPDTTEQENQLEEKQAQIAELEKTLQSAESKYKDYKTEVEAKFTDKINTLQNNLTANKNLIKSLKNDLAALNNSLTTEKENLTKAQLNKDNHAKQVENLKKQIAAAEANIKDLENAIKITSSAKLETDEHSAVLKKINTLIQRDFRGYLLEDIIKYIDLKAKEYCKIVFGTEDLNVYLDGNALDITYCNKMFDGLSGGEKQRCDLILQFAIRDLLQQYLNYSSNIIVLDEIFDNLDKISTTKILDLITNKLKDVESIFIISHHSDELEIPVDSELRVIKNENGISEVK